MFTPFRTVIVFLLLGLIGIAILPLLPVSYTPGYTLPGLTISYHLPNSRPEVVEQQATAPLENALSQVSGIKRITSTSGYNTGTINISFDRDNDIDFKRFEVNALIRQVYPRLHQNLSYPNVYLQRNDGQEESNPIAVYSIIAPYTPIEIQKVAEKNIRLPLLQLEHLDDVRFNGANPLQISIRYNKHLLQRYNINTAEIIKRIKETFNEDFVGIYKNPSGQSLFIKRANPLIELEQLKNIVLLQKDDKVILLKDLAHVYQEEQKPTGFYRIDGLNSITMRVEVQKGVNRLMLAEKVKQQMFGIESTLPKDYRVVLDYDDTQFLNTELNKIYWRAGLSICILLVFIFIFKRKLRYLAVLFAGITVNIVITALLMYILGVRIHLYTLAGLTISFGFIMDNAIVMLDHLARKKDRRIFMALFAASMTTIAALSVIWFLPEEEKNNLMEFGQVIILNLLVSLLIALFFTPALHVLLHTSKAGTGYSINVISLKRKRRLISYYLKFIFFLGSYKKLVVTFFILLFGIPVFLLPSRLDGHDWYNVSFGSDIYQQEIKPVVDKALGGTLRLFVRDVFENSGFRTPGKTVLYVSAELKPGHTLEHMDHIMRSVEQYLNNVEGVEKYITRIYSAEYGNITITFKDGYDDGMLPYSLKNKLTSRGLDWGGVGWSIYGVGKGFSNKSSDQLPGFRVEMKGYNYNELEQQAETLSRKLLQNKRIQEVNINERHSWKEKITSEWVLLFDDHKLAIRGFTKNDVVTELRNNSYPSAPATYVSLKEDYQPVLIFSENADNFNKYQLMEQPFITGKGNMSFSEFADVNLERSKNIIHKENRQYLRIVGFEYLGSYKFGHEFLEDKLLEMRKEMPLGYNAEYSGMGWDFEKVKCQYSLVLLLMLVIYVICAVLFEDIKQPLMIIGTIPIAFIGLFLTFAVFGFYFDQGGYAAFLLLGGLVVNAAIFIVNDLNNLKGRHYNYNVIKATLNKAQPIILTIISTCLGLVPFLLEGDTEVFWFSLAAGTIGGLIFSLVAVFILLPAFLIKPE